MEGIHTLYILKCGKRGQYYTGITTNMDSRLASHQLQNSEFVERSTQWTKYHQPVELAFKYEGLENLSVAMRVERYVKSWKTISKNQLVNGDVHSLSLLKKFHKTSFNAYMAKANISLHYSQTLHPYTAHTQK